MNRLNINIFSSLLLCCLFGNNAIADNPGKLDLNKLLNIALHSNATIKAQEENANSAGDDVSSAISQFFPTPSIQAQRKEDEHDVTMSLTQPVWTGGKLTSALNYAQARFHFSQSQLDEQRFQVMKQVIHSWGSWQTAFHAQQIEKKGLDTLTELQEMMQKRANSGLASEADLTLVNARLMQTKNEYAIDIKDTDNALQQLSLLVGYSLPSSVLSENINMDSVSNVHLLNTVEKALASNPTVRRSNDQIQIADAELKKEEAAVLPTINVKWEMENTNSIYSPYRHDNRVSLNLEQSFGAGLSGYSNIKSALAKRESAIHEKNYYKQSIISDVVTDVQNYKTALAEINNVKTYQQAIGKTLASYQRMFLAGKRDWLDVLNMLNENISAEKELENANIQLVTAGWLVKLDCGELSWN